MKKAILIIALLSILAGCHSDEPDEAAQLEKENLEEEFQIKQRVRERCSRYDAVLDWKKGHVEYTVEVQDALIRTDGYPVLLFRAVGDTVRESEKYRVYFRPPSLFGSREHYALVARVSCVNKVRFELRAAAPESEDYGGAEGVSIELEPSSVFVANGACLGLLDVGDYMKYEFSVIHWLIRIHFVLDRTVEQVSKIMVRRGDSSQDSEAASVCQLLPYQSGSTFVETPISARRVSQRNSPAIFLF